jgi:hypothetical protein
MLVGKTIILPVALYGCDVWSYCEERIEAVAYEENVFWSTRRNAYKILGGKPQGKKLRRRSGM